MRTDHQPITPADTGAGARDGVSVLATIDALEAQVRQVRDLAREHERAAAALAVREREVLEASDRLKELERSLREREASVAAAEHDAATLASTLEQLVDARGRLHARETQLAGVAMELQEREREVVQLRDQSESREAAAAESARRSEARASELATALEELRERLAESEARFGEAQARLLEARAGQAEAEHLAARVKELEHRLVQQSESTGLTGTMEQARLQNEIAVGLQRQDELRAQLARARKESDELRTRLTQLETASASSAQTADRATRAASEFQANQAAAESRLKEALDALAASTAKAERLERREAELEGQRADLHNRLREAAEREVAVPKQRREDAAATRRDRLRAVRHALRRRETQIRKASEALRSRYEQCEKILAMHAEVIAAKRAVEVTRKQAVTLAARNRVSTVVLCAIGSAALLLAMSYAIVQQTVPATYAARAEIGPDPSGRPPTSEEVQGWQDFHRQLVRDPALTQLAAERMGRRGLAKLADPAVLREELQANLTEDFSAPTRLTLEYRAKGRARAQRVLDTYLSAYISQANAARERRTDGSVSVAIVPAAASADPIHDPRPLYAGAAAATGMVVIGLAAGVAWRQMAVARIKFEEQAAAAVEAPESWSPPGATPADDHR